MKKAFYFLAAAALSAAAFTACTGDEYAATPEKIPLTAEEEGEPTYATFTFRLDDEGAATRAPMVTDEYEPAPPLTSFSSIRLLVFEDRANDRGLCLADTLITAFGTEPYPPEGQSATVVMTSGQKRVLVIANTAGKTKIENLLARAVAYEGITYADFLASRNLYDIGIPAVAAGVPVTGLDLSELVPTDAPASSMVYSSKDSVTLQPSITYGTSRNGIGPDDNHFEIMLRRPVAKVTVATTQTSPIQVDSEQGWLQNLKYRIQNVNRSLYLFQQTAGGSVVTPNNQLYPAYVNDDSPFIPYFYRGYDYTDLLPASSATRPVYITENVQPISSYRGATYAEVEAVYVPNLWYVIDDFSFNSGSRFTGITRPDQFIAGSDFYRLDPYSYWNTYSGDSINTSSIFTDSLKAYKAAYCLKYATESGFDINNLDGDLKESVWKYTGGKCYYRIDFRESFSSRMSILRNHHYILNISSFSELGDNIPIFIIRVDDGTGTEDTSPTYITASVTVEPWINDYYTIPATPYTPF
ncbi:MAG: Mfa1 family fimbria major subunit [Tannerellaceae bacterium]|jgi:hypothetical protein|nr:Mfa1 family fimbria major subunit [Tannerellaceae bacterium]